MRSLVSFKNNSVLECFTIYDHYLLCDILKKKTQTHRMDFIYCEFQQLNSEEQHWNEEEQKATNIWNM